MGFTNPVYGNNFADPQVVAVDNVYYAFATNGPLGNVQTLTSPDLVSWEPVGDALPALRAVDRAGPGVGARGRGPRRGPVRHVLHVRRHRLGSAGDRGRGGVETRRSICRQIVFSP